MMHTMTQYHNLPLDCIHLIFKYCIVGVYHCDMSPYDDTEKFLQKQDDNNGGINEEVTAAAKEKPTPLSHHQKRRFSYKELLLRLKLREEHPEILLLEWKREFGDWVLGAQKDSFPSQRHSENKNTRTTEEGGSPSARCISNLQFMRQCFQCFRIHQTLSHQMVMSLLGALMLPQQLSADANFNGKSSFKIPSPGSLIRTLLRRKKEHGEVFSPFSAVCLSPQSVVECISSFHSKLRPLPLYYMDLTHHKNLLPECFAFFRDTTYLNLSHTDFHFSGSEFCTIAFDSLRVEGNSLKSLFLEGCEYVNSDLIESLLNDKESNNFEHASKQSLKFLNISRCRNITNRSFKHMKEIQNLEMENTGFDITVDNTALLQLRDTTHLKISAGTQFTNLGLQHLLENLTSLSAVLCENIDGSILQYTKHLKTLDISSCATFSDHHFKDTPFKLQSLFINHCAQLSDSTLKSVGRTLQVLEMRFCFAITDAGLGENLTSCMKSLDISGCINITDAAFGPWSDNLSQLNAVTCIGLTDTAFKHLGNLRWLSIGFCNQETLTSHLFSLSNKLQHLMMDSCTQDSFTVKNILPQLNGLKSWSTCDSNVKFLRKDLPLLKRKLGSLKELFCEYLQFEDEQLIKELEGFLEQHEGVLR